MQTRGLLNRMTEKYFPVCLDVQRKKCLVAGGGGVGARKAASLEACGAQVTVISPFFSQGFTPLKPAITCIKRSYMPSDLDGIFLVMAATNQADLNREIALDATDRGILCNIADAPDLSTFTIPSVIRQGALTLTISTSGTSPAFAKKLRKELEHQFGKEYADFLSLMGKIRKRLIKKEHAPQQHKKLFMDLIDNNLLSLVKTGDSATIDALLVHLLGQDFSLQDLTAGDKSS